MAKYLFMPTCQHLRKHNVRCFLLTMASFFIMSGTAGFPLIKADAGGRLNEVALAKQPWLFSSGDNPDWSSLQWPDETWQKVSPDFGDNNLLYDWKGIGWFRCWLQVDSNLIDKTLALRVNHLGASEIYVDGMLKASLGKVGINNRSTKTKRLPYQLIPVAFSKPGMHLIAVRYANFNPVSPHFQGFEMTLADYRQAAADVDTHQRLYDYMLMSVAVMIALAMLHLFLFLFYRKQKLNLLYAIFLLIMVCGGITVYIMDQTDSPFVQQGAILVHWAANVLWIYAAWILLFSLNHPLKGSKRAWVFGIITLFFLAAVLFFVSSFIFYGYMAFFILLMGDGLWQVFRAYKSGKPHIWLIGLGMLTVFLAYLFAGSNLLHNWSDDTHRILAMCLGILGLPFCYSLYLALDFAGTNKELAAQALARESEKRLLVEAQAIVLEKTVKEKTAQVQQQADQLREMDALKSRFFINITHEFRTPLTLISGAAQQLTNRYNDAYLVQNAESIQRNSQKLLRLISELLELGKLEAGRMKTTEIALDAVSFIKQLLFSFNAMAGQKEIRLRFSANIDQLWIKIDQEKLEKIIFNLVGNAVKFTGRGGEVSLGLESDRQNQFRVTVTDNGIGIAPSRLPHIFDRFYQGDNSDTRPHEGTGIGLALTKELVILLEGSITVESQESKGTSITVILPAKEAMPSPENSSPEIIKPSQILPAAVLSTITNPMEEQPLILVIEDHPELLHFMRESLTGSFKTIGAADGREGIKLALTHIPDLIITDLMMPLTDGLSVCRTLKEDLRTSHIPIVMLTARVDTGSRIEGLQTGADAYLTKPFLHNELLAQIGSLLLNRNRLRDKYRTEDTWMTQSGVLPSMERQFLDHVKKIIDEYMDDEQFGVDLLGEKVGLSRTQLHRKLKALINQTPGELIRHIRMERAFELLKNDAGNVSQVAYMVGFSNPANFSTSFLRHFGFSPGEVGKSL